MTQDAPRISIGLPVYNGEDYVDEALDSLLSQDFDDFELIVCDNQSTDRTLEILERRASRDDRVKIHQNPENVGGAANFNRVLELSTAEFFRWASHDDVLAPSMVSRCLREFEERDESFVLVYPQTIIIDANGDITGTFDNDLHLDHRDPVERLRIFIRNYRRSNVIFGLMRTTAVKATGGIPLYNPGDVVMIGKLALLGKFAEISEPLFMRRHHDQMSWQKARTPESFARWFDPSSTPKVVFPRWRAWGGLLGAVWSSPTLDLGTKVRASLVVLIEWPRRHASNLVQEMLRLPKAIVRNTLRAPVSIDD